MRIVLCAIVVAAAVGCLGPVADLPPPTPPAAQAQTTVVPDAGTPSPIPGVLQQKCAECHSADAGYPTPFVAAPELLRSPATRCPGLSVAGCVARMLSAQDHEGTGCRTYIADGFHREAWACLTSDEISRVVAWVEAQ